jgi:hypothetical protein
VAWEARNTRGTGGPPGRWVLFLAVPRSVPPFPLLLLLLSIKEQKEQEEQHQYPLWWWWCWTWTFQSPREGREGGFFIEVSRKSCSSCSLAEIRWYDWESAAQAEEQREEQVGFCSSKRGFCSSMSVVLEVSCTTPLVGQVVGLSRNRGVLALDFGLLALDFGLGLWPWTWGWAARCSRDALLSRSAEGGRAQGISSARCALGAALAAAAD